MNTTGDSNLIKRQSQTDDNIKIDCPVCGQRNKVNLINLIIMPDGYIEYKYPNCGSIWIIGFSYYLQKYDEDKTEDDWYIEIACWPANYAYNSYL